MKPGIPNMRPASIVWMLPMAFSLAISTHINHSFDRAFSQFLQENGYRGGSVAAMTDGQLLIAKGYGVDRAGHEITAHSKFPISSVAKSLTGVAIMQLVQDKRIGLEDKVFGDHGILNKLHPWRKGSVDARLYDITVDQLLRHSAGWDSSKGPLYDPLFNQIYLDRNHVVPNIAQELGLSLPLSPEQLISYVISQPLSFTPGTSVVYSNMAYLVLGRVVESVTDMAYRDYVKRFILDPCGMWNTRLEMAPDHVRKVSELEVQDDLRHGLSSLDPVSVDAALGWYSNVYDMMRFVRCAFESRQVLDDRHMELLLAKPEWPGNQENETWFCAGFRTNSKSIVWQDADLQADDLILYHDLNPLGQDGGGQELPDSWVILLHGKTLNHLRHRSRDLLALLGLAPPPEKLFLYDLSDLHRYPAREPPLTLYGIPQYAIKYTVDEHHLSAYVSALQEENFNIHWFTSHSANGHTHFLLISKRGMQPLKSQYDYIFEHGMDHRQLLKRKLQLEEAGYNMTQLHSYKSSSHDNPISFAAIFRYEAFSADVVMKYGTSHLPEPYEKLVQMYYEKEFYPISQTVVYHNKDEQFTFIFIKTVSKNHDRIDFRHYYDLSPAKLAKLTTENAKLNLRLSYLNSYDIAGKFRFSAVYTNGTAATGLLEIDQPRYSATELIISNLRAGLSPKYIAPYMGDDAQLKLATYFEED